VEKPRPFEIRCEHCQTSFAIGTRECVHCGRRLGGSMPQGLEALLQERLGGQPGEAPAGVEAEGDELAAASRGRNILWIITAGLAVFASMMRNCQG